MNEAIQHTKRLTGQLLPYVKHREDCPAGSDSRQECSCSLHNLLHDYVYDFEPMTGRLLASRAAHFVGCDARKEYCTPADCNCGMLEAFRKFNQETAALVIRECLEGIKNEN